MMRWMMTSAVVLAVTSCGPIKAPCDAQSCASGCCDSSGACRAGFDLLACGFGGAACQRCDVTQSCNTGRCETNNFNNGGGSSSTGGGSAVGGGSSTSGGSATAGGAGGGSAMAGGRAGGSAGGSGGGSATAGGRAGGSAGGSGGGSATAGGRAGGTATGGGLTGGGAGGGTVIPSGGGAPAGCTTFTQSFVTQSGGYSNVPSFDEITVATLRTGTTGFFYQLDTSVVWSRMSVPTNVVVPGVLDLSVGTAKTCPGCVTLRNCSLSTACSASYLARSGWMDVQYASRARPGSFIVTLHHVRFDEWLLGSDVPDGSRCFYLPTASFNVNFN